MNSRGFTLIELMIAVAIIGILAAVALPVYREYVAQSYGASALKAVSGFASKAQACVNSGLGCDTVADDIANYDTLSADSFTGGGLAFAESVGGDMHWDNGECRVTANVSVLGRVLYTAAKSAGAHVSDQQCQGGAGLL